MRGHDCVGAEAASFSAWTPIMSRTKALSSPSGCDSVAPASLVRAVFTDLSAKYTTIATVFCMYVVGTHILWGCIGSATAVEEMAGWGLARNTSKRSVHGGQLWHKYHSFELRCVYIYLPTVHHTDWCLCSGSQSPTLWGHGLMRLCRGNGSPKQPTFRLVTQMCAAKYD